MTNQRASSLNEDSTTVKLRGLNGSTIHKVKWDFPRDCLFLEGQKIILETKTEDEDLMGYMNKLQGRIEEISILIDGKSVFVYADCVVEEIKKVLTVGGKGIISIVYVKPASRSSDQILTYMHDFDNCDDKVIVAIRGK